MSLHLTRAVYSRGNDPLPNDRCPVRGCRGRLKTYDSRVVSGYRIRLLRCSECLKRPENYKWVTADDASEKTNE